MQFAYPIPSWAWILLISAVCGLAYATYAHLVVPITQVQRAVLTTLRGVTLMLLALFLLRPTMPLPPSASSNAVVPILVDVSRSMRIKDADGGTREERAAALLSDLRARLSPQFPVEVYTFGETLAQADDRPLTAQARRSDLSGALNELRSRLGGRSTAGIIVISDGGDTGSQDVASNVDPGAPPVFTIGLGSPVVQRDREITGVAIGDAPLGDSVVDLSVTAVGHGLGAAPLELRVSTDGRLAETRRVTPVSEGSPVHEVFTVSPNPSSATLVTMEIPAEPGEVAPENNRRSLLVSPPGRKRRVLFIEGAPGFEHSFLRRAWALDSGIEVDAVVRKGRNDQGANTYFVQADATRSAALQRGYPASRETLFVYDAIIFGNIEGDFFSEDQLEMTAEFVSERGGGLLVLGAQSFAERGLVGTPLEDVLPLELSDRNGVSLTSLESGGPLINRLILTSDGEHHPLMRLTRPVEENRRRWAALPALASSFPLGNARPGAQVLAIAPTEDGSTRPIVAVQRYGRGRSMVFAGEAAWRWKMFMPSSDRSYEIFWRQAARWLSTSAPDPVSLVLPSAPVPGEPVSVESTVADRAFRAVADAAVTSRITLPGGDVRELKPALADARAGRYAASFTPEQAGIYRIETEAHRGSTSLGTSERWLLVGGTDPEFADPRLNEELLQRVAAASGGRYFRASDAAGVVEPLRASRQERGVVERRDLWNTPWAFAIVLALLSVEWTLRRRWGLR